MKNTSAWRESKKTPLYLYAVAAAKNQWGQLDHPRWDCLTIEAHTGPLLSESDYDTAISDAAHYEV